MMFPFTFSLPEKNAYKKQRGVEKKGIQLFLPQSKESLESNKKPKIGVVV